MVSFTRHLRNHIQMQEVAGSEFRDMSEGSFEHRWSKKVTDDFSHMTCTIFLASCISFFSTEYRCITYLG